MKTRTHCPVVGKLSPVLLPFLLLSGVASQAQLINGNFETGDFTGWTTFNLFEGGLGQPAVVLFDTANNGMPSLAAQFEAGQASGTVNGNRFGGGIQQQIALKPGQLNVSINIATEGPAANSDGGTFELLLGGYVVATHSFGAVTAMQPQWSTLSYSGTVGAIGTFPLAIEVLRSGYFQIGETPYQYIDNIQLSGSAVPEPSALLLLPASLMVLARIKKTAVAK